MKKTSKCLGIIAITMAILLTFAACNKPTGGGGDVDQIPVAGDYTFGKLTQAKDYVEAVTITPKGGKSPGARTIYYNGSTTIPQAVGTYPVTFDVAAATGWEAATGLSAGTLTVTVVEAKYQFNGTWYEIAGYLRLDENSLEEYEFHTASVTGLYTKGGGTYLTTYSWAFLYQGDQKYGIVFTNSSDHFVILGQTSVDADTFGYPSPKANGITVDTGDMQNTVNGNGDEW